MSNCADPFWYLVVWLIMGFAAGVVMTLIETKKRWRTADDLREIHWAMDEKHRIEVRTGRPWNWQ